MDASYTRSHRTTNAQVRAKNPTASPRYQRSAITYLHAPDALDSTYLHAVQGRGKVAPATIKPL
jgi:hypothetical protein